MSPDSAKRVRNSKENALTDAEIEGMMSNCQTIEEKFVVPVLIYSGMRVSEFCRMKKDWIDFVSNKIMVPSGKTKAAQRSIPIISPRLEAVLKAWFSMHDDVPYTKSGIWRMVNRVARRAKIEHRVYPHALRATFASLLGHKVTAPTLMYIAGWSQLKTSEIYVKSNEKRALEEANKIEL